MLIRLSNINIACFCLLINCSGHCSDITVALEVVLLYAGFVFLSHYGTMLFV